MKSFKIISLALLLSVTILSNSCKKVLEEHPRSIITPAFLSTPPGLLAGIAGVYNDIRSEWGTEGFSLQTVGGTDESLMGASNSAPKFFTYNGLASSDMNGSFWNIAYQDINTLNGVLLYGPDASLDTATKQQYLAQAKFLRGFWYFYLVQTFGDVPLHTTFITEPSAADSRQPIVDVYNQIIQDLTEASTQLQVSSPAVSTATQPFGGKAASQATALYLLAKVYLTRGWLNNSSADFSQAYSIATNLINNRATYGCDLWQDYADALKPANDYGKETLFTSDHSSDPKYGQYMPGASGGNAQNLTPWFQRWNYPSLSTINSYISNGVLTSSGPTMMTRDVANGRPYIRVRPNSYVWTSGSNANENYFLNEAFSERINDSRYDKTFQTVWIANTAGVSNSASAANNSRGIDYAITVGVDTAVWMPDHEVAGAPQFNNSVPFKGLIIPPSLWSNSYYPVVKKFDDPNRTGVNDPSTRPVVIFRFADVYLVAAEAAFKLSQLQNAADMINVIRQRASYRSTNTPDQNAAAAAAVTISASDVTLDFILDERSREFYGEWQRWWDLVRTQSLVRRVTEWNPEAAPYIKSFHVLRPIPQQEIDLVTEGPAFPQNEGY